MPFALSLIFDAANAAGFFGGGPTTPRRTR